MTEEQKALRDKLTQEAFDYYVWNKRFQDNEILNRLYRADFCKSLAERTLAKIKRDVIKEWDK